MTIATTIKRGFHELNQCLPNLLCLVFLLQELSLGRTQIDFESLERSDSTAKLRRLHGSCKGSKTIVFLPQA